ncbi:MAG: hypothetical protein PHI90_02000 [Clostridia bacterium]|nr:hypothetical protein [Clostridia bacterium]MDD4047595.1 hypothetical protein [Clostridia bacterium]
MRVFRVQPRGSIVRNAEKRMIGVDKPIQDSSIGGFGAKKFTRDPSSKVGWRREERVESRSSIPKRVAEARKARIEARRAMEAVETEEYRTASNNRRVAEGKNQSSIPKLVAVARKEIAVGKRNKATARRSGAKEQERNIM